MGLQFRKRTKGKDSWFNFSGSKKNGLGASLSVKLGKDITYNTRGRVTINFGNGFRYVATRKKKRAPKEKVYKSPKNYSYRAVKEYRQSQQETLCSIQEMLLNMCKCKIINNNADLQITLDLYNAIEIVKDDPNSQENHDLILVTTNQFKELAATLNQPEVVDYANTISSYVRDTLPFKHYDKFFSEKIEKIEKQRKNKIWILGTIIFIVIVFQMCSG